MMELNSLPLDSGGSGGVGFHAPTSSGSTSATSSATTTPMADANGNTLGAGVTAGAVSPVAAGDSGSVHRVGHKRSHSRGTVIPSFLSRFSFFGSAKSGFFLFNPPE